MSTRNYRDDYQNGRRDRLQTIPVTRYSEVKRQPVSARNRHNLRNRCRRLQAMKNRTETQNARLLTLVGLGYPSVKSGQLREKVG